MGYKTVITIEDTEDGSVTIDIQTTKDEEKINPGILVEKDFQKSPALGLTNFFLHTLQATMQAQG